MKKGLVLEGGGIRGIFSAGVMDVLMEEGIEFDGAIGVSAGAAFGCNYKSRQPRRAIRYNLKYAKDPRYSSVRSLLKTGDLFNAQFCYHDIPEKLYPFDWKTFRENPMQFFLVCTDVETGKPVYHLCDNDSDWQMLEWFRASGSMPLVSRVVEIGSQKLLDGGISDSIPLRFMENKGYDRNVVILTRPAGYVKEPAPMMRMISRVLQQYPEAVKAMENRHNVYNETLAYIRQREAGKFAFVIRPEEDLDVGRIEHDRFKIREAYKAGRRAARKRLNALRRFLDAADNEVFADGTYSTNASIIANAPGAEPLPSDDFLTYEEKTAAEAAPAGEENAAEKAPSYVGTIEEAIPAPAEEKKNEKDASSFRAQVFGEAIDEQAGFEKPVSFVDRQEAALRRERESAIEAEEAAEKEAAEKAEAERIAAEKAEAEKLAAEKAEEEKIAAEKAEAERIAAEKAEAERIAAEKAEAERIAAEKAEAERIAAEKAEAERIAAEKAEAERIAAEKAEAERIAAEKAEAERIAAEKAEAARIAAEKRAAEKAEAERIAAEKRAAARKAREDMIAAEKAAAEKAAEEKAAAMKAAMERAAAAKASAVTGAKDIAENISEANSPLMLRGRRQKKTWKPGNMTSLKKQEGEEE